MSKKVTVKHVTCKGNIKPCEDTVLKEIRFDPNMEGFQCGEFEVVFNEDSVVVQTVKSGDADADWLKMTTNGEDVVIIKINRDGRDF